jgi:hypothetical protein
MGRRKCTEQCGWNRAEMPLRGAALVTMMESADHMKVYLTASRRFAFHEDEERLAAILPASSVDNT